jgi:uncharacterized protein
MTETVLITGAGSGIGRELTRLFARDRATIVAASLVEEELASLEAELLAECDRRGLVIDTLVNNAGFACFGDIVEEDRGKLRAMIGLNIATLTELSMLFGARMKARGAGTILNVGSTAGMVPTARMAAYCASKSYVNSFTFALGAELAPFGVKVTCLTPGSVQTNFGRAAGLDTFEGKSMLKTMFAKGKAGSAAQVAKDAYTGLRAGKRHVLTGKGARLAAAISRLFPPSRVAGLIKDV